MKLLDDCANFNLNGTKDGTAIASFFASYDFNVDLRTILGNDIYDQHEFFGICLNSISLYMVISNYFIDGVTGAWGSTIALKLKMTGLTFVGSTLNGALNSSTSGALFPDVFTPGGSSTAINAYRANNFSNSKTKCIIFRKPKNSKVSINLSLMSVMGTKSVVTLGNSLGPVQSTIDCNFSIFPAIDTE
jgi:hypothetical protein